MLHVFPVLRLHPRLSQAHHIECVKIRCNTIDLSLIQPPQIPNQNDCLSIALVRYQPVPGGNAKASVGVLDTGLASVGPTRSFKVQDVDFPRNSALN